MIHQTLEKLRQLTQIDVQSNWYYSLQEIPPDSINLDTLEIAQLNEKGYITWLSGRKICTLVQKIIIPHTLKGYPLKSLTLRLLLTWWAEDAKIFIDGKLVQQGDLFDSSTRLLLTPCAIPGQEILVTLHLMSPGHDIGGLMRSTLVYEQGKQEGIDPGFIADELTVLYHYLTHFYPEKLDEFTQALTLIDWDKVNHQEQFDRSLLTLRKTLHPLGELIKNRSLNLLGHAHLDLAWLWPVNETWQVAQNTFESVLTLQKDFSNLTFCHTSPALYAWIEKNCPDLFKAIQEAVKAKSWEVLGGMWVEPEVNLVSGESLVRQLLYGQRYFKEKFGTITTIAWLPDSFGFSWQLPQLFKGAGIEYFVTGKLHWNDTTKFPYGLFWWQAPDGTKLLTLMSPPNVTGIMDTNPITMSNYAINWEHQTGFKTAFWLPGVGDHGGGPTRDMLEVAHRWQQSPFFPTINFNRGIDYLSNLSTEENLPLWQDELYLEFHRGCYTTHADQKSFNRRSEKVLYQAELWVSLATIIVPDYPYPKTELETAWKQVLFNQFHDILPGTSIPEVFEEANRIWQEVQGVGQEILDHALKAIAGKISLPKPPHQNAKPVFIFNSLNWERSEVVAINVKSSSWDIYDSEGNKLRTQYTTDNEMLFFAQNIPSIGYKIFWVCPTEGLTIPPHSLDNTEGFILENDHLKVIINPNTGDIDSIFDKIQQREILAGYGNQLQAYQDQGQYWDAWNIDPNYAQYPLPPTELKTIQYLEKGELQTRIRVIRQLGNSEFSQDYILQINSPILKIKTRVNWQETHVLVKAAFALNLSNDYATYEIPCGAIERPTNPQTPSEQAKWEVYGLHWADITDHTGEYGVSLLNDCKYGYDSQPEQIRLTLLRSPIWPDPNADRGIHEFTYALYPHRGTWQSAKTVQRGYELNVSLQIIYNDEAVSWDDKTESASLPVKGCLLNLPGDNLVLMTFKVAEDSPKTWILRCYESCGHLAKLSLNSDLGLKVIETVNLLEEPLKMETTINPWKIVSYQITLTTFNLRDPQTDLLTEQKEAQKRYR
ncbi:glycosyl hydrolase 38 domain protein [Gloeothece citriformis PCC 7424]|uniref:Glycosyl hydrolase 38 domain protein n=1 Tax=Gloeothece citriformis (strain PCC 7424) TaxID=65393 RepID=B7K6Q3_GLOC7|nr:glycosyl hydrolase 38 domain protein [Gloeothece citriformis PCC 7424]